MKNPDRIGIALLVFGMLILAHAFGERWHYQKNLEKMFVEERIIDSNTSMLAPRLRVSGAKAIAITVEYGQEKIDEYIQKKRWVVRSTEIQEDGHALLVIHD